MRQTTINEESLRRVSTTQKPKCEEEMMEINYKGIKITKHEGSN